MRIASYNIRKAIGTDWIRDAKRVESIIGEIGADVVVLQEADKRLFSRAGVLSLDRLEQAFNYKLVGLSSRAQSHGWYGNVIFVKKHLETKNAKQLNIPFFEPRGAVSIELIEPSIEIIGVHLALMENIRAKQFRYLVNYIRRSKKTNIVLAGDFNEWRKDIPNFHGIGKVITPGPTFHSQFPVAPLDRFVLTGSIDEVASGVYSTPLAKRASDHLPIFMDISLR